MCGQTDRHLRPTLLKENKLAQYGTGGRLQLQSHVTQKQGQKS